MHMLTRKEMIEAANKLLKRLPNWIGRRNGSFIYDGCESPVVPPIHQTQSVFDRIEPVYFWNFTPATFSSVHGTSMKFYRVRIGWRESGGDVFEFNGKPMSFALKN